MKYCAIVCVCIFSLGGLFSCGLEADDCFIDYIPRLEYNDTGASVYLPQATRENGYDESPYGYFTNFIIFYRIYTSANIVNTGRQLEEVSTERTAINPTLNSDYVGLYNFTDITSTNVNTSNLENTFGSRKYFLLTLEDTDINNVLDSLSLGQTLEIAFPPNPGAKPTLTIGGKPYYLQRAVESQILSLNFRPQPNRDFLNNADLYNIANITNELNADVATNSAAAIAHTYVAMYIAARGMSLEMPPRAVYSQPTFIGIFKLADRS